MKTMHIQGRKLASFDNALTRVLNRFKRTICKDREELTILFGVENDQGDIYREISVGEIMTFALLIRLFRKYNFLVEPIDPDKDGKYQAIVRKSTLHNGGKRMRKRMADCQFK